MINWLFLGIAIGVVSGSVIAWLVAANSVRKEFSTRVEEALKQSSLAEGKSSALDATLSESRAQNEQLRQEAARDFEKLRETLNAEQSARVKAETERSEALLRLEDEKKLIVEARENLTAVFKAIASDTLSTNSQQFLDLSKEALNKVLADAKGDLGQRKEAIDGLVKPLSDSLKLYEEHLRKLETKREQSYTTLEEHLKVLTSSNQLLQKETGNLATALRTPHVRGQWGQMTLRRVVELSGMSEHCDFDEQQTVDGEEGRFRPDLIVHLPSNRDIVVDAKVALDAYLSATNAENEEQRAMFLQRHAQQVRKHMTDLGLKDYGDKVTQSLEFVVMFIPGESFFAEAAHRDLSLIEDGMKMKVIPSSPTTLIALLRAVAYGWRQEQIAKSAQEISELGKQLYERMRTLVNHLSNIGDGLEKANTSFNKAVASLETRVFPSARRFKELGSVIGDEIPLLEPVDTMPRAISIPEIPNAEEQDS